MPKPTDLMKSTAPKTAGSLSYGELLRSVRDTQTEVDELKSAMQGELPKNGVQQKPVESKTTQQAVTQEAGVQGTTKGDNEALAAQYSKRAEWAGEPTRPAQTISNTAAKSAIENKNADSTVRNTVLSYYSKREFESTPVTASKPISEVTPTRVDNTVIGTLQNYAGTIGGGLTAANKFVSDRLYNNNNNVTAPGLTDYAREYYSDKDDEYLRKNLSPAVYKAVTNAMKTNADMRQQALEQRNATDALQAAGQEKLQKAKEGTGKVGSLAVGVGENVLEMTADRAIGAALSYLGVPQKVSQYAPLYLRSLGGSEYAARTEMEDKLASQIESGAISAKDAETAREQNENKAFLYGNLAAGLELATETALSPTNFAEAAYGKGWLNLGDGKKMVSTLSRKLAKSELGQSLIYMVGSLGIAGVEEAGEEAVSGIFEPLIKRMTYDKDAKFDAKDTAESMVTAFLATVLTGGAGVAQTNMTAKVYNNPTTVNSLIDIAKTTNDENTKARQFAENLSKVVEEGGKPTNMEVVDLIHYLNESGSEAQTNKLYEVADVDKNDSTAKAQLHGAITYAMQEANEVVNEVVNNKGQASAAAQRNFDSNVSILANALVSEDVADALKPTIAYTLQQANSVRAATESTPVGIRRGDTVSYHVSQAANETAPEGITGYDVIRRRDNGSVDYITADDFNGSQYPVIVKQVTVDNSGNVTDTTPQTPTIINDKSTLVSPNYTGFDVEAQRQAEDYWKSGRRRTGIPYNTTQMSNKTYFDNYLRMLQAADKVMAVNNQEVNNNGRTESIDNNGGRSDVVAPDQQGSGVSKNAYFAEKSNELYTIRTQYGDNGTVGKRTSQVSALVSALRSANAQAQTCAEFAGEVGGVDSATVIPVTGKLASRFSKLTSRLRKAGIKNVKYYAGDLVVEHGADRFIVNGANNEDGSTVYVCVDNLLYSPEEIANHELFHTILKNNPGMQASIIEQLRTMDGFDELAERYLQKYEGTGETEDSVLEELLCDAYGGMNIFEGAERETDGKAVAVTGAEVFQSAVAEGVVKFTSENANTSETAAAEVAPAVETTEVPGAEETTENAQEITEDNVNSPESQAETTEENVESNEPIKIQRERNGEWEEVSREDAVNFGKELYKTLGIIKDDAKRLQAVNKTIQGYELTAEDVGGIQSVEEADRGDAVVDEQTNSEIERAAAADANHEIWDEDNAKLIFTGKEKSPDAYQWEVVEEKPNGSVVHMFFDAENKANAYAKAQNEKNGTGAAITVDLSVDGALEDALAQSTEANEYGYEDKKRAVYSRAFVEDQGLEPYSQREIDNWKNSKRIVIAMNESSAKKFVNDSLSGTIRDKTLYFGKIRQNIADRIKKVAGVDVTGYNCSIGSNEIRKTILNSHGDESKEESRGQRPVTVDDIINIPNAINNADDIIPSDRSYRGAKAIEFRTVSGNERVVTITISSDGRHELRVQTEYINIKRSLSTRTDEQASVNTPEAGNGTASNGTIAKKEVDVKYSRSFDASGRNLTEAQAEYFIDSKVRDEDGNLMPVYHGTDADFNIFDLKGKGGKNGTAEGFGIYLTNDEDVSKHYGGRIIEAYSNITRPATSWDKTVTRGELSKLIQNTCELEADSLVASGEYDDVNAALKDTWISNYIYTPEHKSMDAAYRAAADVILQANDSDMDIVQEVMAGMGIRDYDRAINFYNEALTPTTGIDGLWTKWKAADGAETADVMLAFNSNQVKNVDNLAPTENEDIRYSRKLADDGTQLEIADFLMQMQGMNEETAKKNAEQVSGIGDIYIENSTLKGAPAGRTLALRFREELIRNGNASLVGQKARTADDLATLAQIYRNPKFETTRYFFTNDTGDIVYNTGVTANLVDASPITTKTPLSYMTRIIREAKEAGATGVYFLHNHPSGDPTPSGADFNAVRNIERLFRERGVRMLNGIIIDSNKYSTFDTEGAFDVHNLNVDAVDELLSPKGRAELVSNNIKGPDDLARLAKAIQLSPDYSGVIYFTAKFDVNAVQEIHNSIAGDEVAVTDWVENNMGKYGARSVAFVTTDPNVATTLEKLYKDGLGVDVIHLASGYLGGVYSAANNSGGQTQWTDTGTRSDVVAMDSAKFSRSFNSVGEMNQAYNDAVANNKAEARKIIRDFAEENGYQYKGYHGTPYGNFNVFSGESFDRGANIWLSKSKSVAKSYQTSYKVDFPNKQLYDLYARMDNPFRVDAFNSRWDEIPISDDMRIAFESIPEFKDIVNGAYAVSTDSIVKWAKQAGYDGVIFNNIYDSKRGGDTKSTEYAIFDKTHVKSADLVTYGDDGKVIPLSARFSTKTADIRFSRAFDTPTRVRAKAESEYIKTMVTDFNSSTESKNKFKAINPAKVAADIKTRHNSTVDVTTLQRAVNQVKQYASDMLSTGRDVNYADAKGIALAVARQVVLQNTALTETDGYKAYAKMLKFTDEIKIRLAPASAAKIENFEWWKTQNLDNIHVDNKGMPVEMAYARYNQLFGDALFPKAIKTQYGKAERIAEVVGNYRAIYENPYNDSMDIAAQYVANDIMNEMFANPGTIALGDADLTSVYDAINERRESLLDEVGRAYENGGDGIKIANTETYQKAQTIEEITEDDVDFRNVQLNPEEWQTTKTDNNKAKAMSPTNIIAKMEHDFGFNITEGQIRRKGVLGLFNRRNKGIRILTDNDIPTAAHELGHALDREYGISSKLTDSMKKELLNNHDATAKAQILAHKNKATHIPEAIAEFNRIFLENKDNALTRFPEFSKFYLNTISEDHRANLLAMADIINAYYVEAANTAQPSVRLRSEGAPDYRTTREKLRFTNERAYQDWVDSNYGIKRFDKVAGSKAYIFATNAAYSDARAMQVLQGELFSSMGDYVSFGLKGALDGVNVSNDAEYRAFGEYLIVKHGPEFIETTNGNVFVNPVQNTATWMNNRAAELEAQYPQFAKAAQRVYEFQNNLLQVYGVDTGLVSQEVADEWRKRWSFYVPFNRVIVKNGARGFSTVSNSAKNGFANQGGIFKRAKGSTKDLYHPIENIETNVIRLVKAGLYNQVGLEIADAAKAAKVEADFIEEVPKPMKQVKMYTDQLRESLEHNAQAMVETGEASESSLDDMLDLVESMDSIVTQYTQGVAHGDVISIMRNGEAEYYRVNDPLLLESLGSMHKNRFKGIVEAYGIISRMMTSNITGNNIIWSLSRNAPKDLGTLLQYSKTKNPVKIFGGITSAYGNSFKDHHGLETNPFYMEYLAMGGGKTSAYTADIDLGDKVRRGISQKKSRFALANPIKAVEWLSDTVELGPRYATYVAMRTKGMNPQEAFYEACDVTVNFRKGGRLSREVNLLVPFFNANVQGIDKFVRFFTADDVNPGEKAKVLAGRAAFFVASSAVMAAITAALNYRDKKDAEEYMQLSSFTKNNYWCIPAKYANRLGFKMAEGQFLALPKARELGILSSFMERMLENYLRDDEHAWDEFATYVSGNLLPAGPAELAEFVLDEDTSLVNAFGNMVGNVGIFGIAHYLDANKDFLGRNIVSESLLKYEKKDQWNGRTSIPAYYIGQFFNASPQQIDFFGEQVFSNVWKPVKAMFPKDDFYQDKWLGIKDAWIKDNQYSNDLVNWMYDQKDASEKAKNSDKENGEKLLRYKMDSNMSSFYSTFYGLQKELDETVTSRQYRQAVLDMISDYRESVDIGIPASQRAAHDVAVKAKDTSLLPLVMGSTVKDASGNEYELDYAKYYEYQTKYNNVFYETANSALSKAQTQADKEIVLGYVKKLAKSAATDYILAQYGVKSGDLDRYGEVALDDVAVYKLMLDQADATNTAVDEKTGEPKANGSIDQTEATLAISQMDWLTPHEMAVLWQAVNTSWASKNNPWKAYL